MAIYLHLKIYINYSHFYDYVSSLMYLHLYIFNYYIYLHLKIHINYFFTYLFYSLHLLLILCYYILCYIYNIIFLGKTDFPFFDFCSLCL